MNVLVIEYEKTKAQKIKDLLSQIDDSIQVIGITDNMQTAAAWLAKNKEPDIILANEEVVPFMHSKRSRHVKAVVTFSTISEEYNFAAYRYKTMRRLLNANNEKVKATGTNKKYLNSIDKDTITGSFKERFLVKQGQRLLSIPVGQVAYFFSQERFIFLKTFDNQKFLVEYRIEQLEKLLSPDTFFRINRSHIISLPTVKEIHAYFGNRLKLYLSPAADKEIIVSRKRVHDFKEWLDK
ncbi:LytR/AlgR family response regulator transcription factor [Terrimonas pollutisoli]|uniref:LytR/AlgR family response regulator transcription factor n=1 Tax=Terrimonas pollutisoli TaxID=3034147 RepID=UPI0023EBE609|nr:LytTR family DNA-binding domain-containing protein [Terrimonas sp. H1YJ31]